MQLRDLQDSSVVIWGCGREASAFLHAIGAMGLRIRVTIVDEVAEPGQTLEGRPVEPFTQEVLDGADYVFRSPGVSIYRPELANQSVITATGLWFGEVHSPVIAVTGTKGKSTTASLTAHILEAIGVDVRLAGNIGRSPLDFVGTAEPTVWVIELSSFQISDADAAPDIAVLTSLDSDHLDWHGDQQHYIDDKLRLFERAGASIANVQDPGARAAMARMENVIEVDGSVAVPPSQLFGDHNAQLVRLSLAALKAYGVDLDVYADAIARAIQSFSPLPHRLEPVREVGGVLYVNDSLSTNPIAATAAIKAFVGRPIALLLGGHDRGLAFEDFGAFVSTVPDIRVYTLPECGERIASYIVDTPVIHTGGLDDAVRLASDETPAGGVVLLAPAAASFGQFSNYVQRGEYFRQLVNRL